MPDAHDSPGLEGGQSLIRRPFTRRQLLQGGLVAGSAAFLAACGTSATPAPTAAPPTAAPTAAPATPAPTTAPATSAPSTAPSATASAAPATPTPAPSENFQGIQLHNFTGGYMIPWLDAGTAAWKAATGGDAISDNVDFASKQIKQAGIIATQDSSYDMMYTTAAYGYIPKFGARLLLPVTSDPDSYG